MKKCLSPAFSLRSLGDQEAIVSQCVDRFVSRMGEPELNAGGLNMTKWYEMVAFDILGELGKPQCLFTALPKSYSRSLIITFLLIAFGESFHSIEDGMVSIDPSEHPRRPSNTLCCFFRKTTLLVIIG